MQRIYRERRYYCGQYMEVDVFPVYTKARSRGKRGKPTTDIQHKLNQRHTEGKLRRLLHTNFTETDQFVTLTFDDAHLPASVEAAQRLLQNFLRRAKRRFAKTGMEPKYIYILEYGQKQHRLHAHLVISGGLSREELRQIWGMGEVSADALRFDTDGLAALAKYLTKGSGDAQDRPTWKRWSGSRNLEKPEVVERDGRLSHRKVKGFCEAGGDTDYLETEFDGWEVAGSMTAQEDIYGGFYLSATLKRMPPRVNPWVAGGIIPLG